MSNTLCVSAREKGATDEQIARIFELDAYLDHTDYAVIKLYEASVTARDTCDEPCVGLEFEGDMPIIFHPNTVPDICIYLNDKTAEYRNRIKDYLGI